MCNIGTMMHWCFDFTNKCHSNYRSYGLDWIGFRKLDPRPTLEYILPVLLFSSGIV